MFCLVCASDFPKIMERLTDDKSSHRFMSLKLIAPEYSHKPWNYCNCPFINLLGTETERSYLWYRLHKKIKDLIIATGLLLPYLLLSHVRISLSNSKKICNRLTFLVIEVINLPYLKVVFAVFLISFSLHFIKPFYTKTIAKG